MSSLHCESFGLGLEIGNELNWLNCYGIWVELC
jgi:hypothetical protein